MTLTGSFSIKLGILMCGGVPATLKSTFGEYAQCLLQEFDLADNNDIRIWNFTMMKYLN